LACAALFLGVTAAVFASPVLRLDLIEVVAEKGIDSRDIRSVAYRQMEQSFLGSQKNVFFFSIPTFNETVRQTFDIETLSIKKRLPNSLVIHVSGRPYRFLWSSQGKVYDTDSHGRILKEHMGDSEEPPFGEHVASARQQEAIVEPRIVPSGSQITTVIDEGNQEVYEQDTVLTEGAVAFALQLPDACEKAGIPIAKILTTKMGKDFRIETKDGWNLRLTSQEDLNSQLSNVSEVIAQKIKGEQRKLDYIDARFGNRVYHAFK
jgi:cell division septal protein FtsQ